MIHTWVAWGVIACAVCTFLVLLVIDAPYGRHQRSGWGPTMPTRWAWVAMEAPALFLFVAFYLSGPRRWAHIPMVLLAMWLLHYGYRTLVYPFRISVAGKRTTVAVVAMGMLFNSINAYLNGTQVSAIGDYPTSWLTDPRFMIGVLLFFVGRRINVRADEKLMELRKQGGGYKIPQGGLYRYISCPNYFGEIVEWIGWALATWSLAGASFAIFTAANLVPRALAHHRWYHEKFVAYPRARKAVLPFVL